MHVQERTRAPREVLAQTGVRQRHYAHPRCTAHAQYLPCMLRMSPRMRFACSVCPQGACTRPQRACMCSRDAARAYKGTSAPEVLRAPLEGVLYLPIGASACLQEQAHAPLQGALHAHPQGQARMRTRPQGTPGDPSARSQGALCVAPALQAVVRLVRFTTSVFRSALHVRLHTPRCTPLTGAIIFQDL